MSVQTQADWTGQQLANDRYLVGRKLGEGGMAIIYLAQDRNLGNKVVIKAPRAEMLNDKDFSARFTREIRSLVQMSHPHILKILDVGQHNGFPFAVLQYLAGGSLRDRQPRSADGRPLPMAPETLHSWLGDAAAALDYMHQKGYIHRDIKPDNLLFDDQGNVYLADFGIAKVIDEQRSKLHRTALTQAGTTIGPAQYMAAELILAKKIDHRVDQYALAVTVYELLTGQYPFDGANPTAIFVAQAKSTPMALHSLTSKIPAEVSTVVAKALSKEPKNRFASCGAFAEAVLAALGGHAPASAVLSSPAAVTKAAVTTPAETQQVKRSIACPHCDVQNLVPVSLAHGVTLRCRRCQKTFKLPDLEGNTTKGPGGKTASPGKKPRPPGASQPTTGTIVVPTRSDRKSTRLNSSHV